MRSALFTLRPPRHPLLRAGVALVGLALLGVFAVLGLVVGAVVFVAWSLRRLLQPHVTRPAAAPVRPASGSSSGGVIEGEFVVVNKTHPDVLPR